jgi:Flp pilus assembly protein TadD
MVRVGSYGPNALARLWATDPDANLRDPAHAIELARMVVRVAQNNAYCWNTLGAVLYRNRDWSGAIESLNRSMSLLGDDFDLLSSNGFFLAMAHRQLEHKDEARQLYDQAVQWMQKDHDPPGDEVRRFRAEAAELLGLNRGADRGENMRRRTTRARPGLSPRPTPLRRGLGRG